VAIGPQRRELAQKLFEGARERQPQERAAYLEDACPSDPQLREYILRMVAVEEEDTRFLETPVFMQMFTCPLLERGDLVEGRFRIVRLLGAGGMGEVYEAVDTADPDHPERVALKTIRRELAGLDEIVNRLRREVQLIHKVTHPNVCKVHYLGIDRRPQRDLLYLTMDFLEGETLSQRLRRTGPLSKAAAFSIAAQIAAGLDAAHEEGVIHQDLKSSNVMLVPRRDGTTRAVITDFGIARSQDEADAETASPGTPAYMAPERWTEPVTRPAADIYSFGVILYEMLTGRLPFDSGTPLEHRRSAPPAPSAFRRGIGRKWERVTLRCLDPSPDKRFATASDAVAALRTRPWPAAVAAFVLLCLLAGGLLREYVPSMTAGPVLQAVAFLPFQVSGGSEAHEGLEEYLAEQIQRNPAIRGKWLVFSPAEVRRMRVTEAAQASAILGASHVLTGTITLQIRSLSIAGELVEAKSLRKIGSFQKACPLNDSVCLQDGILNAIARVLAPQTYASVTPPPISSQALQDYLQGLYYLRRDSESYELAIPLLLRAIAADAAAVQPRVALADAYLLRFRANADKTMLAAARKILEEVLSTHPDLPDAHASFAMLHRAEGRYEDAARHLVVALQIDPSSDAYHRRLALVYDESGDEAGAIREFEKAIWLQPLSWAGHLDYAVFHHRRGRFQEAADLLDRFLARAPDHAQILAALGGVYVALGRNGDAARVSQRSCSLQPGRTCYTNLGFALQRQRRTHEAIAAYERAIEFGKPTALLLFNTADAYAYLGDRAAAAGFFRQAVERLQEDLKTNLRQSGRRAMLAYCLAQLGESDRAVFELEQVLHSSPEDWDVRRYGVLTFESLGQREKALEVLLGAPRQVLEELELAWGTEQLRQDPRYRSVAQQITNR
jgi:eukaryotic-like serine/threonine-protein kinase